MLIIRLSRIGKKKKPMYRLIVSEKARDPYGRALEILGSYNPFTKNYEGKKERIEYWISKGAQTSVTVNNLLIEKGVIKGEKLKATKPKKGKENKESTKKAAKKPVEKPAEKEKTDEKTKSMPTEKPENVDKKEKPETSEENKTEKTEEKTSKDKDIPNA